MEHACVASVARLLPFSEKPMATSCSTISGLGCSGACAAGCDAAAGCDVDACSSRTSARRKQQAADYWSQCTSKLLHYLRAGLRRHLCAWLCCSRWLCW